MANMSYCRFQNTKKDLDDCITALENLDINSKEEKKAAKHMIENFLDWCVSENIIEDYSLERIHELLEENE